MATTPEEKAKRLIYQYPNTDIAPPRKINNGNKTSGLLSDQIMKQISKTPKEKAYELVNQLTNEKKLEKLKPKEVHPNKTFSQFQGNFKNATSPEFG